MKLYELADQYRADVARLQDLDLTPETVLDTIDGMQGEITEKIKAVLVVAMEMDAEAGVRAEHGKRMAESAKSLGNRAEGLRSYAQIAIQNCGLKMPLKYPEFSVNLQANPASCEVVNAELLPPHLKKTTVSFETELSPAELTQALATLERKAVVGTINFDVKPIKKDVLDALKEIKAANDAKAQGEELDKLPGAHINPTGYRVVVK